MKSVNLYETVLCKMRELTESTVTLFPMGLYVEPQCVNMRGPEAALVQVRLVCKRPSHLVSLCLLEDSRVFVRAPGNAI